MKQQLGDKMKKWLVWLGSSVAVLCLAFAEFWYWINIPPQVEVPAPELPSPNGYDYFFRAGEAFVRDDKGVDEITDYYPPSGETKNYPIAAKGAWLEKNASALQLLREGLKYEAHRPPVRSLDTALPELSQFRDLARALAIESRVRAERGDWNGAIQSALDCYSFGNQIGRGGPQVPGAMSVAIRNIGLRELGDLLPHIDAATARETAAKLEKIYEHRYPYYKILEDEKWNWVAGVLLSMKEPSWRTLMFQAYNNPVLLSENVSLPSKIDNMKWLVFSKRKLIDGLIKAMDMSINNARRPYKEQSSIPITKTGSPLGDMLQPVYIRTALELGTLRYHQCISYDDVCAARLLVGAWPLS